MRSLQVSCRGVRELGHKPHWRVQGGRAPGRSEERQTVSIPNSLPSMTLPPPVHESFRQVEATRGAWLQGLVRRDAGCCSSDSQERGPTKDRKHVGSFLDRKRG